MIEIVVHAFEHNIQATIARHFPAKQAVLDDFCGICRIQDRDHCRDQGMLRLMGTRRRFPSGIVGSDDKHATIWRRSFEIG